MATLPVHQVDDDLQAPTNFSYTPPTTLTIPTCVDVTPQTSFDCSAVLGLVTYLAYANDQTSPSGLQDIINRTTSYWSRTPVTDLIKLDLQQQFNAHVNWYKFDADHWAWSRQALKNPTLGDYDFTDANGNNYLRVHRVTSDTASNCAEGVLRKSFAGIGLPYYWWYDDGITGATPMWSESEGYTGFGYSWILGHWWSEVWHSVTSSENCSGWSSAVVAQSVYDARVPFNVGYRITWIPLEYKVYLPAAPDSLIGLVRDDFINSDYLLLNDFSGNYIVLDSVIQGPDLSPLVDLALRALSNRPPGPPSPVTLPAGEPVNPLSGSYEYQTTDLAIPGRGPGIAFQRAYNSDETSIGPLGPGWTHTYNVRLVRPTGSDDVILVGPLGRLDRYARNGDGSYAPPPGVQTQLVKHANGTFTATLGDQSQWGFDNRGKLLTITDRFGNLSRLGYDAFGNLTGITDPARPAYVSLTYGGPITASRLVSITDWLSRTVSFGYDANNRLSTVTDREGKSTTYGYDSAGRLNAITDANGHVALSNTYDGLGRVAEQRDAKNQLTTFEYRLPPTHSVTATIVTYPATSAEPSWQPKEEHTFDAQGRLVKRVLKPTSNAADNVVDEYGWDSRSNLAWVKGPRGQVTDLGYDLDYAGQPITPTRGLLTRRIDPAPSPGANRPVTLLKYDAKHNLIQVVPPRGVASSSSVTLTTDLSGALNLNYATDFGYDATLTRLLTTTVRATDPELGLQTAVTTFEYDDANPGLLTRIIPPRGNTGGGPDLSYATSFTYFPTTTLKAGLLASVTDPLGNKASYDYDAVGRQISLVDAQGNATGSVAAHHTWRTGFDREDRVITTTAPSPLAGGAELLTQFQYDHVGNRTVIIDAAGQVTRHHYDELDRLSHVVESPITWTNPAVLPSQVITTAYSYDANNNLTRVVRGQGSPDERVTDYLYDGAKRQTKEIQYPAWPAITATLITTRTYDAAGNPATLTDPNGKTTSFTYDALNRLTQVTHNDVNTPNVSYSYDAAGNRATMVDGTGTTSYVYDELNRLTTVTSPVTKTVGYRYDRDGNRTKLIYPDSTAVSYAFNRAGQLVSLTDWANRTTGYAYSPVGALSRITNTNGTTSTYTYDNAKRLTQVDNQGPTKLLSKHLYTLDQRGNRTAVAEPARNSHYRSLVLGDNVFTYFRLGETSGTTAYNETGNHAYDGPIYGSITYGAPGALVNDANPAMTFGSGEVLAGADYRAADSFTIEAWVKTTNTSQQMVVAKQECNASDIMLWTTGTATVWRVDDLLGHEVRLDGPAVTDGNWHHLVGVRDKAAGKVRLYIDGELSREATDPNTGDFRDGTRIGARYPCPGKDYFQGTIDEVAFYKVALTSQQIKAHYDEARLTNVSSAYQYDQLSRLTVVTTPLTTTTYAYDAVGNRLSRTRGVTTTYSYDRADRLLSAGGVSYSFDHNGNQLSRGADSFSYDQANRLRSATISGTTTTFGYDGDGKRITKTVGVSTTASYLYDVNQSLPVLLDDGGRKYVWGIGLAYAVGPTGTVEVYHTDGLGSVRAVSDSTGNVVRTYETDEFGVPALTSGNQPFGYTGEPADAETGLLYLRARYYDPPTGRFLSRDSFGGFASSPASLHRYTYAHNNPVNLTDPSGHVAPVALAAAGVGVAVLTCPVWCLVALGAGALAITGVAVYGYLDANGYINSTPTARTQTVECLKCLLAAQGQAPAQVQGPPPNVALSSNGGGTTPSRPYKRPSYSVTPEQRQSVQGKPCIDCGTINNPMVADHKVPLVNEYYRTGTIDVQRMRDLNSVQAQCPICSAKQGGQLAAFSRAMKRLLFGY